MPDEICQPEYSRMGPGQELRGIPTLSPGVSPAPATARDLPPCELPSRQRDVFLFEEHKDAILQLSMEIGRMEKRADSNGRMAELAEARATHLDQLSQLRRRYPDLEEHLPQIIALAEARGAQQRLQADRWAVEAARALGGLGVNYASLAWLLEKLNPIQLALLKEAFRERYDQSLEERISHRMKAFLATDFGLAGRNAGLKQAHLLLILSGDQTGAAAAALALAIKTRSGERAAAVLERHHDRIGELETRFQQIAGKKLIGDLEKQFKGARLQQLRALREGDLLGAACHQLDRELEFRRPRFSQICSILERTRPDGIPLLSERYQRLAGRSLRERLESSGTPGDPLRDRALALLDREASLADVAKLRAGIKKVPGEWPGELFLTRSASERRTLVAEYERRYGRPLMEDLHRYAGSGERFALLLSALQNGKLTPAQLLRSCMLGFGTDVAGINRVLRDRRQEEVEAIEADYLRMSRLSFVSGWRVDPRELWRVTLRTLREPPVRGESIWRRFRRIAKAQRDLKTDLFAELSGEERKDVEELLAGASKEPATLMRRLRARHAYERSGKLTRIVDLFTREGRIMDRQVAAASLFFERHCREEGPGHERRREFELLCGLALNACDAFRRTKHDLAYLFSNLLSAVTAGVATSAAAASGHTLLAAMAATGIASLLGRVAVKWGLTAQGYAREQFGWDVALSTIDGLTLAAGRIIRLFGPVGRRFVSSRAGRKAVRTLSSFFLKRLVKTGQQVDQYKGSKFIAYSPEYGPDEHQADKGFDLDEMIRRLSLYT